MSWAESRGTRISKVEWGFGEQSRGKARTFYVMTQYWLQLNRNWVKDGKGGGGGGADL